MTYFSLNQQLSGTHDMRRKIVYSNWNAYRGNTNLINQFLKEYGNK